MQLFTIRNLINFLLGIGWGGVCFWSVIPLRPLLAIVAILCGSVFVAMFLFMFKQMKKLESNGAFRIQDCVGMVCPVYLRIPATREGQGKVQISLHGSVQEISAMTDGTFIPTGARVRVIQVIDDNTLLVEPI
jgi:membrane protein implicated in regulation of membrane protease activity